MFDELRKKYFELLNPTQGLLSNVGKAVEQQFSNLGTQPRQVTGQNFKPVFNNLKFSNFQQVAQQAPKIAFNAVNPANSVFFKTQLPQLPQVDLNKAPLIGSAMNNIQNPIANFAVNQVAKPIAESFINLPSNVIRSNNQNNRDIQSGAINNPRIALADIGQSVNAISPLIGMGGTGSVVNAAIKPTVMQGVNQGAITGLKYGAGLGLAQGLESGRDITDSGKYLLNVGQQTATGAIAGTVLGGGLGGVTNALKLIKRTPDVENELLQKASMQPRMPDGKYTFNNLVKPKGMTKPQWDFQIKFNQQYGRNPYSPVYADDLKRAVTYETEKRGAGLSIRDINKDKNPLGVAQPTIGDKVQLKGMAQSEPLPWEQPGYTPLRTDVASQAQAEANTMAGNMGNGGIEGLVKETRDEFQKWVNTRRATNMEGFLKKKEFVDLDNQGMEGIFRFQAGERTGKLADVQKYFDTKRAEVTAKTGQDFGYKKDYLPGLWQNSEDEIQKVFGNKLSQKSSFQMQSIIKDYEEGINAGLTPKFSNISDLVGWYEGRANKLIADHEFFSYLGKGSFVQPSGKAPQGWVTLDPDRFPRVNVSTEFKDYSGAFKAPPELAKLINNYLRDPQHELLTQIANYVSRAKNITLNFGIPGTGINAHGFNELARHTLFGTGGNPVSRFLTASKYMVNPGSAEAYLDDALKTAPQAMKNGLTISAEDYIGFGKQAENLAGQFSKKWENAFGTPLFNKMIPALKLSSYENLVKNGMNEKEAAKVVNNVYGGINWEQMGRNRDTQNLLRAIILAPDWAETSLRVGGNLAKTLNPLAKGEAVGRYRAMTATLMSSIIALNAANKLSSGHYAYENEPGHTFEFEAGYTEDGQKRYLRPYGTAADFIRLPFDAAIGLSKGDPSAAFRAVSNRLSIPLSSTMHLLTNQDYKGQAIYGKDKYGNELAPIQSAGGIGGEALGLVGFPSFAKNLIDIGTGKQGLEQGLTQAVELPLRYTNIGKSNLARQVEPIRGNLSGQELYDFNKSLQGQDKLSDNQFSYASSKGIDGVNEILGIRKANAEDEKTKKELENGGSKTSGNKILYNDNGTVRTIDLNPPTKGTGIDAFTNQNWKYTRAREVYGADLSQDQKDSAYKKLGVDKNDVEYDYISNKTNDIKAQYIASQNLSHDELLNTLLKGRVESISGSLFAANGVIDDLNDQGLLSNEEAKALKAVKLDKTGKSLSKTKADKKPAKIALPKIKAIKISIPKAKRVKIVGAKKLTKVKTYKLSKAKFVNSRIKTIKRLT